MVRLPPRDTTVKALFALSGNYCAFPGCTQRIFEGGTIVGTICHIEAAESGGERFNQNQTDEERRSFENLILLCGTHHTVTDNVEKYKVEDLRQMKANHEARFQKTPAEVPEWVIDQTRSLYSLSQTNVNIGGTQINNASQGASIIEVIAVFKDLFEMNFPRLREEAQIAARASVEEFRESFISKASQYLAPHDLQLFSDPNIQFVVNQALQSIARRNRPELRENLAYLLIERIKNNDNDFVSTVINEAIVASGRLTHNQLILLAARFTVGDYLDIQEIDSWEDLERYYLKYAAPFLDFVNLSVDSTHLAYAGCVTVTSFGPTSLGERLKRTHTFLFFPTDQVEVQKLRDLGLSGSEIDELFTEIDINTVKFKCRNDQERHEFSSCGDREKELWDKVDNLWNGMVMPSVDTVGTMANLLTIGKNLTDTWSNTFLGWTNLTSVGTAIAAAYCSHVLKEDVNIRSCLEVPRLHVNSMADIPPM